MNDADAVFWKNCGIENKDIKLITLEKKMVSEKNYHTAKLFTEYLLSIEMKKTQILMNKPGYLGLSIQELMYEFWYDYVKAKKW